MDTKKLILAIVLSIVVIIAYQYFFMKPAVNQPPQPAATSTQPSQPAPTTSESSAKPSLDLETILNDQEKKSDQPQPTLLKPVVEDQKDEQEKSVTVETERFTAVFTNQGAGMKALYLKKYKDDQKNPLNLVSEKVETATIGTAAIYPFYFSPFEKNKIFQQLNNEKFLYQGETSVTLKGGEQREITFRYADRARNIFARKTFVISNRDYTIKLELEVIQEGASIEQIPVIFGPDLESNTSKDQAMLMNLKIAAYDGNNLKTVDLPKLKTLKTQNANIEQLSGDLGSGFFWSAYETNYFAAIFKTNFKSRLTYQLIKQNLANKGTTLYSYLIVTNPEAVFLGPKDEEVLGRIENNFPAVNRVIEYGWFGSIAKLMLKGINLVYRLIPNYGWAIVIFTLLLKILLFPLTYSSSVSMAKMQTLQPKMKAIRKKYKNQRDPEQRRLMNMEIMAMYKQEKVNPAGGCLPLLLQLPILWGFFRLLSVSISVRHEPWMLWITDLSKKDPYYVLPILMGVTQLIVQKMTPSGGDETQKKLMYIMPVVMVVLFASFPSGLNLYWFFSNVLQIGQQKIVNERIYDKKKEEEKERKFFKRKQRS